MKNLTSAKLLLVFFSIYTLFLLNSCDSYQKVVKNDDLDYKYKKAIEFYNKGAYYKAIPVIEDLLVLYKGTERAEELYFYFANSHYQQGSYIIAAYHFKNYVSQYPFNELAPECLYLYAMSHYNVSPEKSLDQTNTYKAIEAFQVFINTYPSSERVAEANEKIDKMRKKLEAKTLDTADLYYKTAKYRAASLEYMNLLVTFPDVANAEQINFKALKARYKYAEKSTYRRQVERYEETFGVYRDFVKKYPESKYRKDAEKIFEESNFNIIKASYQHALTSQLNEREKLFRKTIRIYDKHFERITDEKFRAMATQILEESYFMIVKSNYQLAQNSATSAKPKWYNKAINSYYNFIDKYSSSKFADEAERIYEASTQNLNKIKNG